MCDNDEALLSKRIDLPDNKVYLEIFCSKCRVGKTLIYNATDGPLLDEYAEKRLIDEFTYEHQRSNKESVGNDLSRKNPVGQADRRYPPGMGKVRYDDY